MLSNNWRGALIAGALAAMLPGCGDFEEPAYREAYRDDFKQVRKGLSRGECVVASSCGNLAYVDCGVEVDGASYYVDMVRGKVLEVCGGACMFPREGLCVACPPPEWTCS